MTASAADTGATAVKDSVGLRAPHRFVGQYTQKVDAKGRVSIPADLRRQLTPGADEPASVLYCFPSLLDAELQCGGPDLVETLLQVVATADVFDGNRYELEGLVTEETERLYFDETGRIVLPKHLREHAKLDGSASFGGRGSHFVIAAAETRAALRAKFRQLSEDQKATLRGRSLPTAIARRRDGE